jgi:hypothetical protein
VAAAHDISRAFADVTRSLPASALPNRIVVVIDLERPETIFADSERFDRIGLSTLTTLQTLDVTHCAFSSLELATEDRASIDIEYFARYVACEIGRQKENWPRDIICRSYPAEGNGIDNPGHFVRIGSER